MTDQSLKEKTISIELTEKQLIHSYIVMTTILAWMNGYKASSGWEFFGGNNNPKHCHDFKVLEDLIKSFRRKLFDGKLEEL